MTKCIVIYFSVLPQSLRISKRLEKKWEEIMDVFGCGDSYNPCGERSLVYCFLL